MMPKIYSEAFFKLSIKENTLEDMIEQFENFMSIASHNPDWIVILDTPTIRNKAKRKMIEELQIFSLQFINFIMLLIRHKQIRYYQDIYEQWIISARSYQKIAFVQLYSARPLKERQIETIRKEVQDYLPGLTIQFQTHLDPSMIKGIRLIYQGRSIERSLRRTIEDMKSNI